MIRVFRTASAALLACAVCAPAPAFGQGRVSAIQTESNDTLAGVVVDGADGRVRGASVVIRSTGATAFERIAETGSDGMFRVAGLPGGRYSVFVAASGFSPVSIDVDVPATAVPRITLTPAAVVEYVSVVSASRQEELRQSLNTRVDVVNRTTLQDTASETVGEALRDVAGVMTRRGSEGAGAGGEQIQGIDSRQVLVLLDGQPLVAARGIKRGGLINLDRQSTSRLERVEVVKGAASALYGSDALGGVINLITREASRPLELSTSISGGTTGVLNARTEAGIRRSSTSGFAVIERHQQDSFDLTPTTFDTTGAAFRRYDGLGKVTTRFSPAFSLSGLVNGYTNRTRGNSNGELGPQQDEIEDRTLNAGLTVGWQATPATSIQGRVYRASFTEQSTGRLAPPRSTPLAPGLLDERFLKLDASITRPFGTRQLLQGGVEWAGNEYAGINRLRDDRGHDAATSVGWFQHRLAIGSRVTTTVGTRFDRHSVFGSAVSPKIGANARVTHTVSVRASYGRGFRAPDLGQLYYRFLNPTNFYQVIGNEHLRPEYADSVQLGAEFLSTGHRARFGANVFRNAVEDLIESVSLGYVATEPQLNAVLEREGLDPSYRPVLGRLLYTYKNVNDVLTRGAEVDGELAIARGVSVAGAYTYLDAIDRATGRDLTGRHRHHGNVRLAWASERIGLRANVRGTFYGSWIALRTANAAGVTDTTAPAFSIWNAYVSQRVVRGVSAFFAVENIADNQDPNTGIVQANGTPAPIYRPEYGRGLKAGLRWSWAAR